MAEAIYLPEFSNALVKYSGIRKLLQKKIERLLDNPRGFGEPLKYDLEGLSSFPVRRNFIVIYVYCRECRIKGYQMLNDCPDCAQTSDEVVKFLTFGPHDSAYMTAKRVSLS